MSRTLTNKYNMPDVFYRAALQDSHTVHGDISVTQLIDAPQIRHLKRSHEYEEDVSGMVWALLGTGVHKVLEESQPYTRKARDIWRFISTLAELKEDMSEEKRNKVDRMTHFIKEEILAGLPEPDEDRYEIEKTLTMERNGYVISGTRDLKDHQENKISDYKVTSAHSLMYPESKKKWAAQMNVYKILSEENGEQVDRLEVLGIFKDWKEGDYKRFSKQGYPPFPIMEIPLDVVDREQMYKYIDSRIEKHKKADEGVPPPCTRKEKWQTNDQWAVMAEGAKRAFKLLNDKELAQQWMESNQIKYKRKLYLQHRPGQRKRCERFCPVRDVCPQYARETKEEEQ